jgi:hypothetical protein
VTYRLLFSDVVRASQHLNNITNLDESLREIEKVLQAASDYWSSILSDIEHGRLQSVSEKMLIDWRTRYAQHQLDVSLIFLMGPDECLIWTNLFECRFRKLMTRCWLLIWILKLGFQDSSLKKLTECLLRSSLYLRS